MREQIRETATALHNSRAAGDKYAVGVLSARLARQVAAYRDALLTSLEGQCDQLQAAEALGDAVEAARLYPGFERTLRYYERLCDRIRASEDLPDALCMADIGIRHSGSTAGACNRTPSTAKHPQASGGNDGL